VDIISLQYGLLGLLRYRENTGYGLAKLFEVSINQMWNAPTSQIYRELKRMEEKGWVTSHTVIQENKPNKRVYRITEDGLGVFDDYMHNPGPMFQTYHDPFLLHVFFGAAAPDVVLERFKTFRDSCIRGLDERVKANQETIDAYKAARPDSGGEAMFWQMTHDYSIYNTNAHLQWAEECIKKLEEMVN